MNIRVDNSDKDHIIFKLYRSPANNNITAKNNRLNLKSKRLYVTATILLNNRIDANIKKYITDNKLNINKTAHLSYIEIKKEVYNSHKNYTRKNITFISKYDIPLTGVTYNKKFYSKKNKGLIIPKGYGVKLLMYIEEYLKNRGYTILILNPMRRPLINYYEKHGYIQDTININIDNDEKEQIIYNKDYVLSNIIMYKHI